ncbi:flagellar biosynthesis anti-sigma factor FlgM [Marinobacterium sediminicola]|uniref:Negative regulator of flagellin synthesis n=1 Tax=Marinobacterium sediminicola TaxID=518898 RepID=A0ABY1RYF7_9GAMM|nr:flagellar biosynthesis anti-sigma factor FlgM [Marinobacterium sediminicola]ULG68806.1 flagellar biosynthesis anti-sigma factor FlgM [Marinobacterium sediminicola]SMR73336.1 anti-sigma-28 factor, FlgM family [Marinobacterium sediminicola]
MAIDFPGLSSVQTAGNRGKVTEQAADKAPRTDTPAAQNTQPAQSDTVRISDAAQALQRSSSSQGNAEVDSDRVAQIKAAIDNGSYKIDNERIAERMLDFEKLLG